jgi:hypothetical protein
MLGEMDGPMSWRERELGHESEAYYRALDQVDVGAPAEACAAYHLENGKSVCDWINLEIAESKVKASFEYHKEDGYVVISLEAGKERVNCPIPADTLYLIGRARELASKLLM